MELALAMAIIGTSAVVSAIFTFLVFKRKPAASHYDKNVGNEEVKQAFYAWMYAEGRFRNLLAAYKMGISDGFDDGFAVGAALPVIEYLSLGMSPRLAEKDKWRTPRFIGNLEDVDVMRRAADAIDKMLPEVEELLMMWRSDHIIALSSGECPLYVGKLSKKLECMSIVNDRAKELALSRGLEDTLRCYYVDGIPAEDLAA